jgi:hypothetical protein
MSISINNLLSQFRVQLPILTTLPEVVPAGAEFYYQGTKWRGLGAGETGLPEGTPWPVKGYKEVAVQINSIFSNTSRTAEILFSDVDTEIIDGEESTTSFGLSNLTDDWTKFHQLVWETNEDRPHGIQSSFNNDLYQVSATYDQAPANTSLQNATTVYIRLYPPQP